MLSVHSLVFYLGIAIASGPLGWLASVAGPRAALHIAGLVTILACIAYAFIGRLQASVEPVPAAYDPLAEHPADARLADALLREGSSD